jgi:hypothetical protein
MWLGIVSMDNASSSSSWVLKSAYFRPDVVDIELAGPLLLIGENADQVEGEWIPHHSQHRFGTAGRVPWDLWGILGVRSQICSYRFEK